MPPPPDKKYYIAYTDGACRGNPGPAGAGVLILDANQAVVNEAQLFLGETTNNVAEYRALLLALDRLLELGAEKILIRSDSELMIKQLKGEYRVKNEKLVSLFEKARRQLKAFPEYTLEHVRREYNREADRLANLAIDEKTN